MVACDQQKKHYELPPGRSGPELAAYPPSVPSVPLPGKVFLEGRQVARCTMLKVCLCQPSIPLMPRPQLRPYRSLDVSWLELSAWPIEHYLKGPPSFGFRSLSQPASPFLARLSRVSALLSTLKWDQLGLLSLGRKICRRLNAYKSPETDLQIGDRRVANATLPQGQLLKSLALRRYREAVTAYVTDRKDFYRPVSFSADCGRQIVRAACSLALRAPLHLPSQGTVSGRLM